jgi:Gram-negative bacterial TonB protein C-terminal
MRRSFVPILMILTLTTSPTFAAPTSPPSLKRVTKWEMRYDEDACTLAARFGEDKDSTLLVMTRTYPGDWFELKIYSKNIKYSGVTMPIAISFGELPAMRRDGMAAYSSGPNRTPVVIVPNLRVDGWEFPAVDNLATAVPAIEPKQEAAISTITVRQIGGKSFRLETGSLSAPLAAMRTCTDDLLRYWGYDPAVQTNLTSTVLPITRPDKWLRSNDFPTDALMQGQNGLVRFRLDVDEVGNVAHCRVLYRTNPDSFADLSCKLISARAKFKPALDSQGNPVKSFFISQIRWLSGSS